MRKLSLLIIICLSTALVFCQKRIDKQYYVDLLQQGSYGRVFDECMNLRNGVYGKCAILDYFIAKSLCLDGYRPKSSEWLTYILNNYPLKDETRKFITDDITNCSPNSTPSPVGTILTLPIPQASVSGMSKMGPILNCADKSQLINWSELFSESDLQSRLFSTDQKNEAINKIQSVAGAQCRVAFSGRFIIVTLKEQNITDQQVVKVTTELQNAFDFYKDFYKLRPPDEFLTVYLMPNQKSLHDIALKIHGIDVGKATLGYSLLSDLSLLGIANPDHVGTLYHELFHLIVRTDAGDIPAWVDEGLASLYSVYQWNNDTLKGSPATWRLYQLGPDYTASTGVSLPRLKELINYSWADFNGGDDINLCKASVDYALSNHFMIYLQEKGLLQSLVSQFKSRKTPGNKNDSVAPDNVHIIENVCEEPVQQIQMDFEAWFKTKYHFDLYHDDISGQRYMQNNYMIFMELPAETSDLLYRIKSGHSGVPKVVLDSAQNELKRINDQFQIFKNGYSSYKNGNNMDEFKVQVEALKKDLFELYNKVKAIDDKH